MLTTEDHAQDQDIFFWFYRQEFRNLRQQYEKKQKANSKRDFIRKHLRSQGDQYKIITHQASARRKPLLVHLQSYLQSNLPGLF